MDAELHLVEYHLIKSLDKQKITPSRENFFIIQFENEDPDKSNMKDVVFLT